MRTNIGCVAVLLSMMGIAMEAETVSENNASLTEKRGLSPIINLKHITRLVLWFEILFDWVSSLLLVAVVSGLTKRREE